jgi:hypothetical protein
METALCDLVANGVVERVEEGSDRHASSGCYRRDQHSSQPEHAPENGEGVESTLRH